MRAHGTGDSREAGSSAQTRLGCAGRFYATFSGDTNNLPGTRVSILETSLQEYPPVSSRNESQHVSQNARQTQATGICHVVRFPDRMKLLLECAQALKVVDRGGRRATGQPLRSRNPSPSTLQCPGPWPGRPTISVAITAINHIRPAEIVIPDIFPRGWNEEGVAGESRLYTGRFLEGVFMRIPRMLKHGRLWFTGPLAVLIVATAGSQVGSGQQTVPFQNGIPVAPAGLAARPLPSKPVVYDTAEGHQIRVVVVTKALSYPWSLAFLPDGTMLVTERSGRLRIIRNGVLDPQPVAGGPTAYSAGVSGLPGAVHGYMDVTLHPRFAENRFIYLAYTKPLDDKRRTVAVARGKWDGKALTEMKDIFVADEGTGTATRLAFGRDGTLFMTTSGSGVPADPNSPQNPNSQAGKILRLRDDGGIPSDNPFAGKPGAKPEVYALGIRSSLGLALHPGTGEMWENENGPNGGDEINIVGAGKNYGWPLVSYGRTYPGPWQADRFWREGFEAPIVYLDALDRRLGHGVLHR